MFLPGGHGTMWDLPGAGRSSICCRALGLTAGWSRRPATAEPDWLMSRKRMASRWLPAVASALAKRMSRETGLPVAVSWGIDDPRMAEHVIAGR